MMTAADHPRRDSVVRAAFRGASWVSSTVHLFRRWPILPVFVLTVLVVCGAFAPMLAPHDPNAQSLALHNAPPEFLQGGTAQRILGADAVGRDILSRLIYGARIAVLVAGVSLSTGMLVGVAAGLVAGYFGGIVDEGVMRLVDVWFAIPFLLLALVLAVVFHPTLQLVLALLAMLSWAGFVRNIRAEVLVLKTTDYVQAARVAGASPIHIMRTHLLPGVLNTAVVIASLRVGGLILAEASLSFLGAGVPSSIPTWGVMISEGRQYLDTAWWSATFPGIAILLVVLAFNFLGDWFRDRWDPRLKQLD